MNINKIISEYLKYYPNDRERLKKLIEFVNNNGNNLFNRKNFNGHITASGYIYCINENKLLLLKHKALNKYLQPGGHIEKIDKYLISAAKREIYEETGLSDLKVLSINNDVNVPFDIDTHFIPENKKKEESEHFHHDFGYLFILDKTSDILIDFNESNGYKWVDVNNLDKKFDLINSKIKKLVLMREK